jgi:hypothetical protein
MKSNTIVKATSAPNPSDQPNRQDSTIYIATGIETTASIFSGLFDFTNPSHHYNQNEADFLRAWPQGGKSRKTTNTGTDCNKFKSNAYEQ